MSDDPRDELLSIAHDAVRLARELGVDEADVRVGQGSHAHLVRRDGRVEQSSEASTRSLSVSLLVEDRFSSHSTSDLRAEALRDFLTRAIAATRYLEPDPARRLPDREAMGRGASDEALEQRDPAWDAMTPEDRGAWSDALGEALQARRDEQVLSGSSWVADGSSTAARATSNGFADATRAAWFSVGGEITLQDDDGRRPEGGAWFGSRFRADLPGPDSIADQVMENGRERLGARALASGKYPMVLLNRATPRILGILGGPLSGGNLYEGRSCLADQLGERIGSEVFTLVDDPLLPRGLASRACDGDGFPAQRRTIVEGGVLRSFYINQYYARKMERAPTTGGRSNWVVPAGESSWKQIASAYPKALLVNSFLGGNANGVTGDFSFGIRGQLLEHGEPTTPISEMNVSGNLTQLFHQLVAIADDPWGYSAVRSPTLVFEDVSFSGQ